MKKVFFLVVLWSTLGFSQEKLQAKFDKRVELMSIVFRLVGNEEYSSNYNQEYVNEINAHFQNVKNHKFISYIQSIRNQNGLGYDAVMSFAVHLQHNEKYSLVREATSTLDTRWEKVDKKKFIKLLNEFNKDSQADVFFQNHLEYYNKVAGSFNSILENFNQNWYQNYYGVSSNEKYNLILGFANGGGNYGVKVHPKNQQLIVNAIMGVWDFDKNTGEAVFSVKDHLPTLIHEYNHSFINHYLDSKQNMDLLAESGEKIYQVQKEEMNNQAYGNWITLVNESLVRASVVRYLIDTNETEQTVEKEIQTQINRGFLWTKELSDLLGEYENSRDKYPDFGSFYPRIIQFFNETAKNINQIKSDFESKRPVVLSIDQFKNNATDVNAAIKEIIITFDREMNEKRMSIHFGESGKEHFPLAGKPEFVNDNSAIKLQLDLKPETEYEFILRSGFLSKEGYPLVDYFVKFKTSKNEQL